MKTIDRIMRVFHFRILQKGRWIYRPKHCASNHKGEDNSKNVWNNESKPCENLRKQSCHVCSLNHWNNCHHENVNWKRHFLLMRQWNIQMTNSIIMELAKPIYFFFHSSIFCLLFLRVNDWLQYISLKRSILLDRHTFYIVIVHNLR